MARQNVGLPTTRLHGSGVLAPWHLIDCATSRRTKRHASVSLGATDPTRSPGSWTGCGWESPLWWV